VTKKTKRRRLSKVSKATRALVSKYVAEEVRTGKYSREQAVAIGISRARAAVAETQRRARISAIMERYR
jgi:hypothetical protein